MNSVSIIARRWFDSSAGNTYFSGIALVDGKVVARRSFTYGYGDHYQTELWAAVVDALELDVKRYHTGGIEGPASYCRRNGIAWFSDATDVSRKRDL